MSFVIDQGPSVAHLTFGERSGCLSAAGNAASVQEVVAGHAVEALKLKELAKYPDKMPENREKIYWIVREAANALEEVNALSASGKNRTALILRLRGNG